MGLVVLESSSSPVTVESLLTHLRIDPIDTETATTVELDLLDHLQSLINAATQQVQSETRQQLADTRYRLTLDRFPAGRVIELPNPPLRAVVAVSSNSTVGDNVVLDPSAYAVDSASRPGRLILRAGSGWPVCNSVPSAVTIDFDAGYEDAIDVPPTLILAIKMLAAYWFENREAATDRRIDTIPLGVANLLALQSFPELVG